MGGGGEGNLAQPETGAHQEKAAEKGEVSASVFIFQAVSRLFCPLTVMTVIFSPYLSSRC